MNTPAAPGAVQTGMALPGLVIAVAMIVDTLLYAELPLYHDDFGLSLAMVGVLLSLNRWIRLFANSGVAAIGERVGPHRLMVAAAIGSIVSTTLYGLIESSAVQIAARILWGISYAALNLATLAYAVSDRANAGKRVGTSRAAIGLVQAMSLVGGAWIVLQVGPRSVFVISGALTLVSLGAALMLPRLPREPVAHGKGFRLPIPHRLEVWGFVMGFSSDGVFLLTLAFLLKDSITSVAAVMATAALLALRWLVEITTGPLGGWIGDRFGARRIAIANGTLLVGGFVLIALGRIGVSSILDLGLLRADRRQSIAATATAAGLGVRLHFVDVDPAERWRRVEGRNHDRGETFRLAVTRPMFDFIETIWQPPDAGEMAALNGVRVMPRG